MGQFSSVEYTNTFNSIIDGIKKRMRENPFYAYNDKSMVVVDYYSINREKSTLDEGLKTVYASLGDNSPLRFNCIEDLYLYGGFSRIELSIDNGEFGLEADTVSSTTYILPNTIIPSVGDIIDLKYLDDRYLFKVVAIEVDTIESGVNFYKIDFEFYKKNDSSIKNLIADRYKFIPNNTNSTEYKSIIRKDDYNYCEYIEDLSERLKDYYIALFYSKRVQTFIYNYLGSNFYDPYVIKFLIDNDIIHGKDKDQYVYLTQACSIEPSFLLEYDRSVYRAIETKDKKLLNLSWSYGSYVDEPLSILSMFKEAYFKTIHCKESYNNPVMRFQIFADGFIDHIKNNKLYDKNTIFRDKVIEITELYKGNINIRKNDVLELYKGSLYNRKTNDINSYRGRIGIRKDRSSKHRGFISVKKENQINFKGNLSLNKSNKLEYKGKLSIPEKVMSTYKGSILITNHLTIYPGRVETPVYRNDMELKGSIDIQKIYESMYPGKVSIINKDTNTRFVFNGLINIPLFNEIDSFHGYISNRVEDELSFKGNIDIDKETIYGLCDLYNIVIKWFNDEEITKKDIEAIQYMNFDNTIFLFYIFPVILYILDQNVKKRLRIT